MRKLLIVEDGKEVNEDCCMADNFRPPVDKGERKVRLCQNA